MATELSMDAARREVERLRLIRRHVSDLPHADRDTLHRQLATEAEILSRSQLRTGR